MEKEDHKYKEIFNNFKKNKTPLPIIQLKIKQQNRDIEKVLCEMDKSYEIRQPSSKKINKSENKTRNKKNILKDNRNIEKIDFGPVTYLTYKENIEDDTNLRRYNFQFLREKIINSKNFRIGFLDKNYKIMKKLHLSKNNGKMNLSENRKNNKNKNRINITPYTKNINLDNKTKTRTYSNNFKYKEKNNEIKNNYSNENSNYIEAEDYENNKSSFKINKNISPFNTNIQNRNKLNINDNDIMESTGLNSGLSYKGSLTNRTTNMTSYSNRNNKDNKINNFKFTVTNYLDKGKPLDLKENTIKNKSKTSSHFNDYKDLFKYYRTNNNFLNMSNVNNIKLIPFSIIKEKIYDIDDISQLYKKKLKNISKKKLNIKLIEKLMKKHIVINSIIDLLTNGKKRKIKLRANLNKIKRQLEHLSLVDKVEKYSDNIPSEKLETFNKHYNSKCQKIGISNKLITMKNGKIYQQSESDSKKLSLRISRNCNEINKLAEQILIDRYYFEEKDSKCKRLFEKIQKEKIDLSTNKK